MHCELPPATNWNFDVQWAPGQLAGIFATATYEGQVSISSLAACSAAVGAGGGDGADFFSRSPAEGARERAQTLSPFAILPASCHILPAVTV